MSPLPIIRRPSRRVVWAALWIPYIAIYELVNRFPIFTPQQLPLLGIDRALPFLPQLLPLYVAYIPFFWWTGLRSEDDEAFTRFLYSTYFQLATCSIVWLLFPVTFPRELFYSADAYNWADSFWRWFDAPNNCLPSLHTANCLLFIQYNWRRSARWMHTAIALGIIASTVLVKQHYAVDVAAGLVVYLFTTLFLLRLHIPRGIKELSDQSRAISATATYS